MYHQKVTEFNSKVTTICFVICVFGYSLITSIFSGDMDGRGGTQAITIPFRALCVGLCLITLYQNIKTKIQLNKVEIITILYILLLIFRFLWDTTIGDGIDLLDSKKYQIWLYLIFLILLPCITLLKSYKAIDFTLFLRLSFLITALSVILSFTLNQAFQIAAQERIYANAALNSISSGHLGLTALILSTYLFFQNKSILWKILCVTVLLFGILVLLRAGSRGPILSLFLISTFFVLSKAKNPINGLVILGLFILIILLLQNFIIDELKEISPILYERIFERETSATSDRDPLFNYAFNSFLESPIWGKCFGIYIGMGDMTYPHNIFLDSMMQLGLIGLILIAFICTRGIACSYKLIHYKSNLFWIGLLWIQMFSESLVSGTLSTMPNFWILLILVFICANKPQITQYNPTIKRTLF